jgi:hypothetical protein
MGRAESSITTKCVVAACPSKMPLFAGTRAPSQIEVTTLPRSSGRGASADTGFSGRGRWERRSGGAFGMGGVELGECLLRDDAEAAAGRCRIGGRRDGDDVERADSARIVQGARKSVISVPAWLSSSAAVGRAGSKAGVGGRSPAAASGRCASRAGPAAR